MIPKIIHYCWFGKGTMPTLSKKCIKSWQIWLPDYQFKKWDETNFDIELNIYVKEAYGAKKYAFVTDYVRLYALYNEGGIYMDTDVEVVKNLDNFLIHKAFSGFENDTNIPTGIIGSEQYGEWVKWQLEYYKNKHFILSNSQYDIKTNVTIISESMKERGFNLYNNYQNFMDMIIIYPKDFFCPKSHADGKIYMTKNTYCIHHFSGSWKSKRSKLKHVIQKFLGSNITQIIVKIKRKCFIYYL